MPLLLRGVYVFCAIVAGAALVLMVAVNFADSIGRQLSMPLVGAAEIVSFAMCIFFFAGIALVIRDDENIRVGLLAEFYPDRAGTIERQIVAIVEVVCLSVLAWMIYDQANRLYRFGTQTRFFEVPVYPVVYLAAALSLIAVCFAVENFFIERTGTRPRPHAIPDEDI